MLLFIPGMVVITLRPRTIAGLELASSRRPFRNMGLGMLFFATVLGIVPVLALTVIGIPLLPVAVMVALIAASLAYLAGAFLVSFRIANAIIPIDTTVRRLGVLAAALIAGALLGMLPFIGWLFTLVLMFFGFGALAIVMTRRWTVGNIQPAQPAMPIIAGA